MTDSSGNMLGERSLVPTNQRQAPTTQQEQKTAKVEESIVSITLILSMVAVGECFIIGRSKLLNLKQQGNKIKYTPVNVQLFRILNDK